MLFTPRHLLGALQAVAGARCYQVAFSGGMDSHVLLHALQSLRDELPQEIKALHVDHGLQPDAHHWVAHCQSVCSELGLPLTTIKVDARAAAGQSPEAAAREARYRAIMDLLDDGDCLLTAHHQDDQAETLLLQLLRGAGPHGLAAMPHDIKLGCGRHARPLLGFSRQSLHGYAMENSLRWIEDPSNFDGGFARNFLRHELVPRLQGRWPGYQRTISRSAALCADAARLIDEIACQDLMSVQAHSKHLICLDRFTALSGHRQRNLLRYWFRQLGLPSPHETHIQHILHDIVHSGNAATALVRWPGAEVRAYRNRMMAMPPLSPHDSSVVIRWDISQAVESDAIGGRLCALPVTGEGLSAESCYCGTVTIRFRRGGERFRPQGQAHTRALKKLCQQQAVPPWQRDRIPLIYIDGQLAAVAGLWIADDFAAKNDQPGLCISWYPQSDFYPG